ncbi:MAG: hypothetical protein NVS4B3_07420 [Gemmatimonadaceae bacterium]
MPVFADDPEAAEIADRSDTGETTQTPADSADEDADLPWLVVDEAGPEQPSSPPTTGVLGGTGEGEGNPDTLFEERDVATSRTPVFASPVVANDLPAWLDESPDLGDDLVTDANEGVALALENVASRIRRGDPLLGAAPEAVSDCAALALALTALLTHER